MCEVGYFKKSVITNCAKLLILKMREPLFKWSHSLQLVKLLSSLAVRMPLLVSIKRGSRGGGAGYCFIRESQPQFENRIMARVYERSIMRSTMYQKAPFC